MRTRLPQERQETVSAYCAPLCDYSTLADVLALRTDAKLNGEFAELWFFLTKRRGGDELLHPFRPTARVGQFVL